MRFLLVGVTGVGVNSATLWLSARVLGLSVVVGGLIAALTSILTNFLLNDAFTWRDRRSASLQTKIRRLGRYYGATVTGSILYLVALTVLTQWVGIFLLLANIIAIGLGGSLNYLMHNLWTWRSEY